MSWIKKIIVSFTALIFLGSCHDVLATNYYVSSTDGQDTCTGLSQTPYTVGSTNCPWKTIAKVNTKSFSAGDYILFKKGDTWTNEKITVSSSGNSTSSITYSSYGSGNKPTFSGFETLTNWTSLGGGIYEASCSNCQATLNMVTIDGVNTSKGRYPNYNSTDGGFLTFESHSGSTSITDNQLTGTPNWTGAQIVIRANRWVLDTRTITGQTNGTLTFAAVSYEPTNGFGYFIQNDIRTLDQMGEWSYDSANKKVQMYFGVNNPTSYVIKATALDLLVYSNMKSYIVFDGLNFEGANGGGDYREAIRFGGSNTTNITFKNSDVSFFGGKGIYTPDISSYINIENNTFDNLNSEALFVWSPNATARSNTFSNIGLIPGLGGGSYSGVSFSSNNSLFENNIIINTGYDGLHFRGNNALIKNNFINNVCNVLDDGGGIYTGGTTNTGKVIAGNIVLNAIGNYFGTNKTTPYAAGIYLDEPVTDIVVSGNTVANASKHGIILHESWGIDITGNTVYNSTDSQIILAHDSAYAAQSDINLTNNIFFAKESTQKVLSFISTLDDINFGSASENYYVRPIDENLTFYTDTLSTSGTNRTFEGWQALTGYDADSHKSPFVITDTTNILFDYNASLNSKNISLSKPMVDLLGNKYTTTATIAPYGSILLIPDPNPVSATTFTLTGPTSGNEDSASTNFTITPNDSYTGTITITPTGSGSTGLSAITKTWSASSTAQTFTITPTVAGTITLTPTNNGGLTNPASLTYTVNAVTPTVTTDSGSGSSGGSHSGGGGGGSSSSNSSLESKAEDKDIKPDGIINIFDFNIIMANWNKTFDATTSLVKGDMSGDGKVDIFDINQLMIYWGVEY